MIFLVRNRVDLAPSSLVALFGRAKCKQNKFKESHQLNQKLNGTTKESSEA